MEMQNTESIMEALLFRYCSGEATVEECRCVEEWIRLSDENYRTAKQIATLCLVTDMIRMRPDVDVEQALAAVRKRMSKEKTSVKYLFTWLQRIAAILFIPLLILFGVQNLKPHLKEVAQMIEVKTNPGMITKVQLPDGSVVYLNSESQLVYPSFFEGEKRVVSLKGEAFFEVEKDSKHQFVILTPHDTRIEVLGTSFNVEAFERDSFVATTLVEGSLRFSYKKEHHPATVLMNPGQKLTYDVVFSQLQWKKTDGTSETGWKDGNIVFRATPLPEALRMLEKRFNVEFVLTSDRLRTEAFTGSFTQQRLERILEIFRISSGIRWRYLDVQNVMSEKTRIEIY